MPSPTDDPQRDLVYVVEKLHFAGHMSHTLTQSLVRAWVKRTCKAYGVKTPRIKFAKVAPGYAGEYDPNTTTLKFDPEFGCNGMQVLHEVAHHIIHVRYPLAQDHGPAFVRLYGELLDRSRLVPFAGWKAVCSRHGVKMLKYLPKVKDDA